MRKLHHRALMQVINDEGRLNEVMVELDARSGNAQDRHYILRDAENDVILATQLVKTVLGGTVAWEDCDIHSGDDVEEHLAKILE
jgi:hypothetical protein